MQRLRHRRPGAIAVAMAGALLLASTALAHTETQPITPDWSLEDAIQQMRDEWQGGTVMPTEMTGQVREFHMYIEEMEHEIAASVKVKAWAFGLEGEKPTMPGPTLRVTKGDLVRIHLANKDPDMEHGLDFHAGQMDSGTFHKAIKPGEEMVFEFRANYPGVFYYHCSAGPVIMHIANGMFGAVIVDPPGYKPEGKEFVLIQNEWYNPAGGLQELLEGSPSSVALNGVAMQYMNHPLKAAAGEKVRFCFVNAGVNDFAAFHVIGTIFEAVYPDGNPKNVKQGVQTVTVPPGGAVITELVAEAGTYPVLTHQLSDATRGALGILTVTD